MARASSSPDGPRRCALIANFYTYDVEGAAAALDEDAWTIPKGDLAPGDQLLFWRTRAPDGRRGVVAFGEVIAGPEMLPTPPGSRPFWRVAPPGGPARRIRFRYRQAPGLPLWLGDAQSGLLEQLTVSRAQGNKLYPVPADLWDALMRVARPEPEPEASQSIQQGFAWVEGPSHRVHDTTGEVDATFHVDRTEDGGLSIVVESRGGTGADSRNVEYNRGLELLLGRLTALGASLTDALVDSAAMRALPDDQRRLQMGRPFPIPLRGSYDLTALRREIGAAQAAVGRAPDAKGEGNRTRRLRLVLSFPGGPPADLAAWLAASPKPAPPAPVPARQPDHVAAPPIPTDEAARRVLKLLRAHGSLTEAEVTHLAGGARAYRRLRRQLEAENAASFRLEPTPNGMLWRVVKEHG